MTVYLKGAPERVVNRCSTILMNVHKDGTCKEDPLDDVMNKQITAANKKFGGSGERVLAFARKQLEPSTYNKKSHGFDIKKWKNWGSEKPTDNVIVAGSFPMWDLQLVGIVSLNDPPRPMVDISVKKCKRAGIKVIMVTGDQPPTAAAIAHQVNIIEKPEMEYNHLVDVVGMKPEDAMQKCGSIVIHGDELAKINREEEALDDNEIEKGRRIMDWISRPEVVFARTTPEQKLLIVNAC